jgi:uncharacterized membrane protein
MEENKQVKTSFSTKIRNYLFTGIVVTAPAAITIYLAVMLVNYIDLHVKRLIPEQYLPEAYLPFGIPGVGLILLFAFFIFVGMFVTGFIGRALLRLWEKILISTPIVSGVYNAFKQIFETFFSSSAKKSFREVVLIEYPRKGLWTLAFVTGTPTQEIQGLTGQDDVISIYVPTTPNPTSGFLIFLPRKDVQSVDLSVEEGLKFVVSVGIVSPVSKTEQMERINKIKDKKHQKELEKEQKKENK